jgi:hypothetical protein
MRRQVLEMEQDLARENEAAGIAALTAQPALLPADPLSKNPNGQPQGSSGSQAGAQSPKDASALADGMVDDDADGRSIYVGNVSFDFMFTIVKN